MNYNINNVAVLGAGVMGASIAAHLAGAGMKVLLLDMVPRELTEKEKKKALTMQSKQVRNRFAQAGKDRVINPKYKSIYDKEMGNLIEVGNFSDDMVKLKQCDWIIEVVVEKLEIKKNLMKEVNEYRKENAIISTNTSGIYINEIVKDMPLEFREHFLGTHFFNPPRYMKLFEIIPNEDTSTEVIDFISKFAEKRLGKGVVLAKDTPNFIANRIGTYAMINVLKLMQKYGFDIPKVDQLTGTAIFRPKSATFRTVDMVGLDIFSHVAGNVVNNIDNDIEKEEFKIPDFVAKLISNNFLGDKTRQGFYKKVKTKEGKKILVWDIEKEDYVETKREKIEVIQNAKKQKNPIESLVYGETDENKFIWETIKNVLLYSAGKIPEIADDYKELDKAMIWGFNWEIGPFGIWNLIGVEKSVNKMKAEGETIPRWIEERLESGKTKFYDEEIGETKYIDLKSSEYKIIAQNKDALLKDIGDGVLCLEFISKGNTITDDVMDMMIEAVNEVENNYAGLVISNQGKNFSAGANLGVIGQLALQKKYDELSEMVDRFQQANLAIKYCKKPVVAAPFGMTLGGGAEITMHCHAVVAHAETYMGLVELGVGLVPGGGGNKELLMRCTQELPKASGIELSAFLRKAWENISMAKVSGSAQEAVKLGYLRTSDTIVMNKDYLIDEAKNKVLQMANDGFKPLYQKPIKVLGTTGGAAMEYIAQIMLDGGFISEYDSYLAKKVAYILTGGNVPNGITVTEQDLLNLEREIFVDLCKEEKTLKRIEYMLKKGRALRN